nr:porin [Ralstonia syzygii]
MATPALAQSNVTLYGLLDSTIRYTTHENAAGSSKVQMGDGVLTGSRWGMRGTEDLGNNTKALFVLESGFAPDTGVSQQGNRLFGRKAYVGLQGDFGAITLGRQFTVIHEVIASYDAMALASLGIVGFQGGPYTGGVRQDNMVKYTGTFGGLTVAAQHALGEAAGSVARSSSTGASLSYAAGPLLVAGGYQVMRDINTYYGVQVPNSNQNVWSLGGSYNTGPATLYLGYTNSNVGTAEYRNHAIYAGMKYAFAPAWSLIAMGTYEPPQARRHVGQPLHGCADARLRAQQAHRRLCGGRLHHALQRLADAGRPGGFRHADVRLRQPVRCHGGSAASVLIAGRPGLSRPCLGEPCRRAISEGRRTLSGQHD